MLSLFSGEGSNRNKTLKTSLMGRSLWVTHKVAQGDVNIFRIVTWFSFISIIKKNNADENIVQNFSTLKTNNSCFMALIAYPIVSDNTVKSEAKNVDFFKTN